MCRFFVMSRSRALDYTCIFDVSKEQNLKKGTTSFWMFFNLFLHKIFKRTGVLRKNNFIRVNNDLQDRHQYFYFLLYKKEKVLVSCKFSISGFRWIYTFWDVLNTIWLFLENVCLSVCLCVCDKNFVASVAQELMHEISWNFIFSITPT